MAKYFIEVTTSETGGPPSVRVLDDAGVAIPSSTSGGGQLDSSYFSSADLVKACKAVKPANRVTCDGTQVWAGAEPTAHYGSKATGTVVLLDAAVAPVVTTPATTAPATNAPFWNFYPGISTPELPYGPLTAMPGESEIAYILRIKPKTDAEGNLTTGGGQRITGSGPGGSVYASLDPVYDTRADLVAAVVAAHYQIAVTLDGVRLPEQNWAAFGPADAYSTQPDKRVQKV